VRGGLAAEGLHAYEPWQSIERRLVDAQAPGLAARVAATGERVRRGAADAFAAMHDVGALYALVRAARRPDLLSEDAGRAVRQALGETVPSEDVLSTPAVADAWFVAARSVAERDRIVNVRTWILGAACRQWAYVLRSSPVHAPVADPTPLGATLYGELCRYPGPAPLRGIFRGTPALRSAAPPAPAAFDELLARHAAALVEEPWRQATPFFVRAHPGELHGSPALVDAAGAALPARLAPPALTLLHAVAGGRPAPVAGVFDGRCVEPLSVCDGGDWIDLGGAVA
jgi:hypothetical protein